MKATIISIISMFLIYISLSIYIYLSTGVSGFLDSSENYEEIKIIIFSVFTVVGIISRVVYNNIIKTKKKSISILKVINTSFKQKDMWLAIIISPIIIATFYSHLSSINSYFLLILFSYENGFFFKTIFEKEEKKI